MKEIELTHDMLAIIDDEDYDKVNQYKWYAWWNGYNWYAVRNQNESPRMVFMHRQIAAAVSGQQVDHKNCQSLDNRRDNLRVATNSQNGMNRGKQKNNTSGFKGVHWDSTRNKWMAQIKSDGKRRTIGRFDDVVDAAKAYDRVATELHGEFARTNF